jgi:hypothetical protein
MSSGRRDVPDVRNAPDDSQGASTPPADVVWDVVLVVLDLEAGCQTVEDEEISGYVRARYGVGDGSTSGVSAGSRSPWCRLRGAPLGPRPPSGNCASAGTWPHSSRSFTSPGGACAFGLLS